MKEEFNMYEDLYGEFVEMGDRFGTTHVWNKKLALKNRGRWEPFVISEEKYKKGQISQKGLSNFSIENKFPDSNNSGALLDYNLARREGAKWAIEQMFE